MTDNSHKSEDFDREKVLARIAKLLTLADASRNPNMEEAAAAAEKAQELLHQYNISLEEAIQRGEPQAIRALVTHRYAQQKEGQDMQRMSYWRQYLMGEICQANYCKLLLQGGTFLIIGLEINITVVQQMYHSIANQLEIMCNVKYKVVKRKEYIRSGATWKKSFLISAVEVIAARLQQEAHRDAQTSATGSALVVRTEQENTEYIYAKWPDTRTTSGRSIRYDPRAERYGREAGAAVQYHKGVNPASSQKRLNG